MLQARGKLGSAALGRRSLNRRACGGSRNRVACCAQKGEPIMPKPKLLITRVLSPAVIERARRDYDVDLNENDHIMSADEFVARSRDKDALLVTLTEK